MLNTIAAADLPSSGMPKTAVIFALFNADAYRFRLLETVITRLRLQSLDLSICLGILNQQDANEIPKSVSTHLDHLIQVYGNGSLFQKEAICNQVVRNLPPSIENLIFLDADI